jgi:transcriptional regulator with XRE-family HTH domain
MKLVEWRKAKRKSQTAVAERLGVSQSQIHRIETGQHVPRPALMAAIVEMTDRKVTANDFYDAPEQAA